MAVAADADLERLLAEAWVLIDRGEHDLGRSRLQKAQK